MTASLAALLAGAALAFGVAACGDDTEGQSDEPEATVQTNTEAIGPPQTATEPNVTQEPTTLTQQPGGY